MKKVLAMLCAAVLLVTGGILPVAAADEWKTISVTFEVDKPTPGAGDVVGVSIVVDGLESGDYWNLLEFEIGYDDEMMEPVNYVDEYGDEYEYKEGEALRSGWIASVSFVDYKGETLNPIKGAIISQNKQTRNGEVMQLFFKVKEGVEEGETITLVPDIKDFSQSVVDESDKTAESVPLVPGGKDVVQMETTKPVLPETCPVSFTADKKEVAAGDMVKLTMNMAALPAGSYWNLLDFRVKYDPAQLEAVMQEDGEYESGAALGSAIASVSFKDYNNQLLVPMLGSIMSADNQSESGELLSIYFRVKEGVKPGDTLLLQPELDRLVQSVITDKRPTMVDMTAAGKTDLSLTVKETEPVTLTSVSLQSPPTKTAYNYGEELNLAGGELLLTYSDNSTETVDITAAMISGYDKNKVGKQTVTVTYEGKTVTFDVTVTAVLTGITLDAANVKTDYIVGEELDLTGLKVTATYSDNTTKDVALSDVTVSGYDKDTTGDQILTVSYESKTATFTVSVVPAYMKGDLNNDKKVDAEDALIALQGATGKITLTAQEIQAGDVTDNDGKVTANDALVILQYATKKITAWP